MAHQNNCQVAVHGISDGTMYMMFDIIENALKIYPTVDLRHGVVHAQITDEILMQKIKNLQAIAYI